MQGVSRSSKAFPGWIPPSFFPIQPDAGDRQLWRLWSHILPSFLSEPWRGRYFVLLFARTYSARRWAGSP
ncbi:hypothetical protein SAMN05216417_103126 [Nitrosospira multiformis]|uniref:Uncharacterized protein n=1 Tax=Nitrosospira multiformis TaxID=1231 RepID=A0A1I7G3L7_9PROT|nr:hypothetical protein SAMN05216417_103126 [Nitrosospira multiformis]